MNEKNQDTAHVFRSHSQKQEDAIFSKAPIVVCCTGIQWGKTRVGAVKTMLQMFEYNSPSDAFIVTAPTYKILNQSSLPAFMNLMGQYGEYNVSRSEFRMHGGGIVYFRTAKDPDSVVGLTNVRGIWGDEAGKYPLYFWDNISGRAAFKNCQITLTTSPYSMNWLYSDIVKQVKEKKRDDVFLVQAASIENPYFPQHIYYERQKTMSERRFNAMYGGQFEKMEGLVYDCWSEENIFEKADFPQGTKFVAGIDWGFNDPFVLLVAALTPEGRIYIVSEFYKTNMRSSEIVDLCLKKQAIYNITMCYADPSRPDYIQELCMRKFITVGAENDILPGVNKTYELIAEKKLKVLKGATPHLLDEISQYHWPEPKDLLPDQDAKEEKPVGQNDHVMDCIRYLSIMCSKSIKQRPKQVEEVKPKPQYESTANFVKRIKRKQFNDNSEKWS